MSFNEILVGSCWWMQLCRMCSFQFWSSVRTMREHSQVSFKHYSFTVIIDCFYCYKILIRSPFCMNLMWYIFAGVVVSLWSSFHFVFWYEVQFLLSCWLRKCWSIGRANIPIPYFTFHFSSEKIDWSWIKQSAASQTRFFWRTNVYWRKAYVPDSVKKKIINGKIWVFTPR